MQRRLFLARLAPLAAIAALSASPMACGTDPHDAPIETDHATGAAEEPVDEAPEELVEEPTAEPGVGLAAPADPIAFVGHGAMFGADGKEIRATPESLRSVQEVYVRRLLDRAGGDARAAFEARRARVLDGAGEDIRSRLYATSALIDGLIEELDPPDAERLAGHNRLLQRALTRAGDQAGSGAGRADKAAAPFEASGELLQLLEEEGLGREARAAVAATSQGGQAYINECAAAGVPIPPAWGTSQWVSRGVLTNEFISAGLEAEVFTYQSSAPVGMCFALPRASGNTIRLLGIICLGKASSNVCFWDNQVPGDSFDIQKGTVVPLAQFAGGADLQKNVGGECTDCHAGENPYIIHPGTVLGLPNLNGLPLRGDSWYRPLVRADWSQNPGPTNLLDSVPSDSKCTACHTQTGGGGRFPRVSTALPGYCNTVLDTAFDRTMPPGAPGSPAYADHVEALQAACDLPPLLSPRVPRYAAVNAVSRATNKIDVFATDLQGVIYAAAWEPTFIEGWRGWWQINGGRAHPGSPVHAVSRSANKLDLFVIGTNQLVATAAWEPSSTGGWLGWWGIQGGSAPLGSHVTTVSPALNELDAFVVGHDGRVFTSRWTPAAGAWSTWFVVGDIRVPPGSAVHAVSRRKDYIDIFATDVNGFVWSAARSPSGGWGGWWQINGGRAHPGAPVTAVSRTADRLDIFVVGQDGRAWTAAWEPSFGQTWQGWWPIGDARFPQAAPLHAVSRRTNHLDVFGADVNGRTLSAAWQPSFTDGWHGWWWINGGQVQPGAPITVVSRALDKLDIFVVGNDNRVWSAAWEPSETSAWYGWWPLGD